MFVCTMFIKKDLESEELKICYNTTMKDGKSPTLSWTQQPEVCLTECYQNSQPF